MAGNLFEMGPVMLDGTARLQRRADNETWAAHFPLLFVDSPVGTGWSFAADDAGYARSEADVAGDLAAFLISFKAIHPEVPSELVIAGESYGGHYVPALGSLLLDRGGPFALRAVAVGDGLTDPATQVLTKPRQAFAFGLVDEQQLAEAERLARVARGLAEAGDYAAAADHRTAMEQFVQNVSGINPYDVRTTQSYSWQDERLAAFFGLNATKDMLHLPRNLTFARASHRVRECLHGDVMRSQKAHVERLLGAGVRALFYQGQFDWKDGVTSNEAWIRTMRWPGAAGYLNATREIWRRACDGRVAGYWRRHQSLEQVVVLGAGHLVPMDQPASAVDMLVRFVGRLAGPSAASARPAAPEPVVV